MPQQPDFDQLLRGLQQAAAALPIEPSRSASDAVRLEYCNLVIALARLQRRALVLQKRWSQTPPP